MLSTQRSCGKVLDHLACVQSTFSKLLQNPKVNSCQSPTLYPPRGFKKLSCKYESGLRRLTQSCGAPLVRQAFKDALQLCPQLPFRFLQAGLLDPPTRKLDRSHPDDVLFAPAKAPPGISPDRSPQGFCSSSPL